MAVFLSLELYMHLHLQICSNANELHKTTHKTPIDFLAITRGSCISFVDLLRTSFKARTPYRLLTLKVLNF